MIGFSQALEEFRNEASLNEVMRMVEFSGGKKLPAVLEWFTGKFQLKGETLLRMQHFLHLSGWEIDDLSGLPEPAFKLGQVIMLNLVDIPTVVSRLGYTEPSGLYRVLQGGGLQEERLKLMQEVVGALESQRKKAVAQFPHVRRDKSRALAPSSGPATVAPVATLSPDVVAVLLGNSIVSTTLLFGETDKGNAGVLLAQVRTIVGDGRISALIEQLLKLLD